MKWAFIFVLALGFLCSLVATSIYLLDKHLQEQETSCAARGGVPVEGYFKRYCFAKEAMK